MPSLRICREDGTSLPSRKGAADGHRVHVPPLSGCLAKGGIALQAHAALVTLASLTARLCCGCLGEQPLLDEVAR